MAALTSGALQDTALRPARHGTARPLHALRGTVLALTAAAGRSARVPERHTRADTPAATPGTGATTAARPRPRPDTHMNIAAGAHAQSPATRTVRAAAAAAAPAAATPPTTTAVVMKMAKVKVKRRRVASRAVRKWRGCHLQWLCTLHAAVAAAAAARSQSGRRRQGGLEVTTAPGDERGAPGDGPARRARSLPDRHRSICMLPISFSGLQTEFLEPSPGRRPPHALP